MSTLFVQLNECSVLNKHSLSRSIQRLPDESVVITKGTIVEIIVSNTEWSWAVKSELFTKLLLVIFIFLCSVHVLAGHRFYNNTYIYTITYYYTCGTQLLQWIGFNWHRHQSWYQWFMHNLWWLHRCWFCVENIFSSS